MNKPWLEELNEQQIKAVTHGAKPLLILAGAGSGKTRVITSRIAWMLAEKGFSPYSILALTFTNKAAAEMQQRVAALVPDARGLMIRTFHSFGAWLLRRNAAAASLSAQFTIYDDDDQVSLLSQIHDNLPRRELRFWVQRISRAKDSGLGPDDDLSEISGHPLFPQIYRDYEERLRDIGNADFGDLIQIPFRLLNSKPDIRSRMQQRFQYILVDEYQDTNIAQYKLLKQLSGPQTWLAVVGDDDQSIYRFRGAAVENILRFPEMFPDTRVIKLEQNYRSTTTILNIASAVVSNNRGRLGKTLWTQGESGDKAIMATLDDNESEADWCADQLERDGDYQSAAILYRTNAQSRSFETTFRRRGIPYRIVGTLSFYQREEVKDVLAFMAWILNPRDEVAFRRIANKPTRGLGKTSLNRLVKLALKDYEGNLLAACKNASFSGKAATALVFLHSFASRYTVLRGEKGDDELANLGFLVQDIIVASGLFDHYKDIDHLDNSRRLENLDELVNAASEYPVSSEGLAEFLELVELDQAALEEEEADENRVTLITIHNTKGLEFNRVIITGMEEGLFPRGDDEADEDDLEEERRLFYVAITRARKQLAFTLCRRRMLWGRYRDSQPSRFLYEVPEEELRFEGSDIPSDPWQPGVYLIHEDYGPGIIQKRLVNGGHAVIHVLFKSGRKATILPEFSSHKMECLGRVDDF